MEELSIRDLIETLLKGKKVIVAVTLICVAISGIFSFFIAKPVYESQAMLMISPINNSTNTNSNNSNISELVESLSRYPQMTLDTYREQVKAPVVLQYVRKEMQMDSATLRSIADKITVNAIKNTNLITISITDNDPEKAAKIANLVSQRFTEFVSETNQKQAEKSAEFISFQKEKEKENVEKISEDLKAFLSQPRGPAELKLELDSKLTQLTEFKTKVTQIKIDEQTTKAALNNAKKLLKNTPKTLVTSKILINDELLSGVIRDSTGLDTKDLAKIKLSDEEINEIYISISTKVNELEIGVSTLNAEHENINKEIVERQKEIELLQAELAVKQQQFDMLNHEVELAKQTYDAYQQKYKEAMIKQSADVGKTSIVVVSEAISPRSPIAPKKAINIVIATVIGLILGSFYVLGADYWRNTSIVKYKTLT